MKLALVNLTKAAERERELREALDRLGLRECMRLSEKFIFDSGMDRDTDTTTAIRETGFAMAEQGRLHLPYPITWVEDPFGDDPQLLHRRCYLCVEREGVITIWTIEDFGNRPVGAQYSFFDVPICIDTNKDPRSGEFSYASYPLELLQGDGPPAPFRVLVGEVLYAVMKFMVVLGTKGTERERHQRQHRGSSRSDNPKDYPYTIVRVPLDLAAPKAVWGGYGHPPRKHFVRGYQWGRHTRPPHEQKWVDSYWRGHEELGTIQHQHYVVG